MSIEKFIQLSGPLFEAVQKNMIFPDGKTFVDAIPKNNPIAIMKTFEQEKKKTLFDLKSFITKHFTLPVTRKDIIFNSSSIKDYICKMWNVLLKDMKSQGSNDTLISLPHPHIVPGGRFRECFYWDSYFTALGLLAIGKVELIKMMVENFSFLIDTLGFIPNGNRVYFSSRSQPPYLAFLLTLLHEAGEHSFVKRHISSLEKEYSYWMNHAVSIKEGFFLNHYFDTLNTPRPEAFNREVNLAKDARHPQFFRHLRAACASGWDFSSRWFEDQEHFSTIWTLNILPIDLNSLLYYMEETLTRFASPRYKNAAKKRKNALQTLFWNKDFSLTIIIDYIITPLPILSLLLPLYLSKLQPRSKQT